MKVLAVLLVVVIALVAAVVKFGGVTGFDPAADAESFVQQVQAGMTWQEVADVKTPRKYQVIRDDPEAISERGPEVKFDPGRFGTMMQSGGPAGGFIFLYSFDTENVFDVYFDPQGRVISVERPRTAADLFNGNL